MGLLAASGRGLLGAGVTAPHTFLPAPRRLHARFYELAPNLVPMDYRKSPVVHVPMSLIIQMPELRVGEGGRAGGQGRPSAWSPAAEWPRGARRASAGLGFFTSATRGATVTSPAHSTLGLRWPPAPLSDSRPPMPNSPGVSFFGSSLCPCLVWPWPVTALLPTASLLELQCAQGPPGDLVKMPARVPSSGGPRPSPHRLLEGPAGAGAPSTRVFDVKASLMSASPTAHVRCPSPRGAGLGTQPSRVALGSLHGSAWDLCPGCDLSPEGQ